MVSFKIRRIILRCLLALFNLAVIVGVCLDIAWLERDNKRAEYVFAVVDSAFDDYLKNNDLSSLSSIEAGVKVLMFQKDMITQYMLKGGSRCDDLAMVASWQQLKKDLIDKHYENAIQDLYEKTQWHYLHYRFKPNAFWLCWDCFCEYPFLSGISEERPSCPPIIDKLMAKRIQNKTMNGGDTGMNPAANRSEVFTP